MIYDKPNRYEQDDILLLDTKQGPDGVFYPVTYEIIGKRRKINGHEVDPTGAPVPKSQP